MARKDITKKKKGEVIIEAKIDEDNKQENKELLIWICILILTLSILWIIF